MLDALKRMDKVIGIKEARKAEANRLESLIVANDADLHVVGQLKRSVNGRGFPFIWLIP